MARSKWVPNPALRSQLHKAPSIRKIVYARAILGAGLAAALSPIRSGALASSWYVQRGRYAAIAWVKSRQVAKDRYANLVDLGAPRRNLRARHMLSRAAKGLKW